MASGRVCPGVEKIRRAALSVGFESSILAHEPASREELGGDAVCLQLGGDLRHPRGWVRGRGG